MSCRGYHVILISSILFPCVGGLTTGSWTASATCDYLNRSAWFGGGSEGTVAVLNSTGIYTCGKYCVVAIACECFEFTPSTKECRLIKGRSCNNFTANSSMQAGKGCTLDPIGFFDGIVKEYAWAWPSALRFLAVLISFAGGLCARCASKSWTDFEVHPENFQKNYEDIDYFERRKLLDKPATALCARFGYTDRQAVTIGFVKAAWAHWIPSAAIFFFVIAISSTDVGNSYTQTIDMVARFYMGFHNWCYFWAVNYLLYDLLVIAWIQKNERKLFLGLLFFCLPTKAIAFCEIMPKFKWSDLHTDVDEATFETAWNSAADYTVARHVTSFLSEVFVAEKSLIGSIWWSMLEACRCLCFPVQLYVHLEPQIMMLLVMPCWLTETGPGMWTIWLTIQSVLGFAVMPQLMSERIKNTFLKGP